MTVDPAPTSDVHGGEIVEHGAEASVLRRINRIPLDIVVTATGERTAGVMVCVLAADLDAYERHLTELNELAARVAGWFEDSRRHFGADQMVAEGDDLHAEADTLWNRTWPVATEIEEAAEADHRAAREAGR